eukprot:SAG22_NODE_16703_length_319_cov_1.886364_1_plen_49_part_01
MSADNPVTSPWQLFGTLIKWAVLTGRHGPPAGTGAGTTGAGSASAAGLA